tara:strand:- start:915 stop:1661 length:747 start_codon:yes stop_codon:yes gene_type:complete
LTSQLIYDGSFEGFLTAVFTIYELKLKDVTVVPAHHVQQGLFTEGSHVITDQKKADRVWKGLRQFEFFRKNVYWSSFSEIAGHEDVMFEAIKYVLHTQNGKDYGHEHVLRVAQVAKMVGREKHRMDAFIRFELTRDGIYFAKVEPDFNVLPLLISHFQERYADQSWIIYDLKRDYGIYYDMIKTVFIHIDFNDVDLAGERFHESEKNYSQLWQGYYDHTNIASRINLKLHTRHVPKRYWKYLNEKKPR